MSNPLKVGVIGVGGIAGTHFPGWKASPHAELVALADPFESVLQKVAKAQEITKTYVKPEDLIADPDIDLIDICTPSAYHAPLAIAALEAGKHVICEKPLAPTPEDISQMIAARDKSGKYLMTAQHFRFMTDTQALKREIDTGILGDVYHARSWMLRRNLLPNRPGFIYKKNSGGGPCIDIGVHILDLTLWMMNHPKPVAVSGITQDKLARMPGAFSAWGDGSIPQDMDVEEFASAFVRFEDGQTLILEVSWMLHHATKGEDMQMWLYGTKSGGHWPSNQIVTSNNETKRHQDIQLGKVSDGMEPHAAECVAFAEAIASGAPSPVPAEESRDVQLILNGLYESAAQGKEIRIS
ncbi:MAG: Gfo/Idh/MocA family oxidoreductase [Armatimonadetes bacterium]|nr:Gfo/Idh/MocA family oxidoreductase [Armatimonadota bacterium]